MGALGTAASLHYVVPELALGAGAMIAATVGVALPPRARWAGALWVTLGALAVAALFAFLPLRASSGLALPASLFDGHLACDGAACALRLLFAAITLVVVLALAPSRPEHGGAEKLALVLVLALGMNLMAMASSLLLVYLAVEAVSLPAFLLAGSRSVGVRFALYGVVASAVMLFGMSWLYGLARSLALSEVGARTVALTREVGHTPSAVAVAAACVVGGLAYKVAAFPFHPWAADVAEGSPPLLAALLTVGPQAAGVSLFSRVTREAFDVAELATEPFAAWSIAVGTLAVISIVAGNLSALAQSSLKRLLAGVAVAQTGTLLLAVSAFDQAGSTALVFALVPASALLLGAFLVVHAAEVGHAASAAHPPSGAADPVDSVAALRGLGARSPFLAASLSVFLFSFVGVPPFAGFTAKLYIAAALLHAPGEYHAWYTCLAAAGALSTLLSAAVAVRLVRLMVVEAPADPGAPRLTVPRLHAVLTLILAAPTVLLGLWWTPLYDFVSAHAASLP